MNYPVVCFKPNDTMVYGFKNSKALKTADKKLTESGVFNKVTIIDSDGVSYLVKNVQILGWANAFWGFSLKKPGRLVHIEFELEKKESISLEELKSEILQRVKNNFYFQQTFGLGELESQIKSSDTIKQLFSIFG
jgi:hypothetical protein